MSSDSRGELKFVERHRFLYPDRGKRRFLVRITREMDVGSAR